MKKERKPRRGYHIYDDYDYEVVAEKCSVCGILKKMKATREAVKKQTVYFVAGEWVTKSPKCKNKI